LRKKPQGWFGVAALAIAVVAITWSPAQASTYGCEQGALPGQAPAPKPAGSRLLFGISPGGGAGAVLPGGKLVPEDPVKQLAALERLAGSHPFVMHAYVAFTGVSASDERGLQAARSILAGLEREGFFSELVVRYMPAHGAGADAVSAYARFIRHVVDTLGPDPRFLDLQVTNEVNFTYAASTSDGIYLGAKDALIAGVEAAKSEALNRGFPDLGIGFNWFYRTDPSSEDGFWSYLGTHGGSAFARSLDWVGLDAYPGTFLPPAPGTEVDGMINALSVLRDCYMPAAGLGGAVKIHVVENGWPTGPGRPEALQTTALQNMIGAVQRFRGNYGVTDYRWFDLRDANSSGADLEEHFGLDYDNYMPKPAFFAYESLINSLDTQTSPARSIATAPSGRIAITISAGRANACTRRSATVRVALHGDLHLRLLAAYVNGGRRVLDMRGQTGRFVLPLRGAGQVTVVIYARTTDGHVYEKLRTFTRCRNAEHRVAPERENSEDPD